MVRHLKKKSTDMRLTFKKIQLSSSGVKPQLPQPEGSGDQWER